MTSVLSSRRQEINCEINSDYGEMNCSKFYDFCRKEEGEFAACADPLLFSPYFPTLVVNPYSPVLAGYTAHTAHPLPRQGYLSKVES